MSEKEFEQAERLYRKLKFKGKCGFGKKPAVMVIDMEKYATLLDGPIFGGPGVVDTLKPIRMLLDKARAKNVPVIYTVVGYEKDPAEFGVLGEKIPALTACKLGSKWTEIDDLIAPKEGDTVLSKRFPSAFYGTDLQTRLIVLGIDTLIFTGHSTSACVRSSVVDAISRGYRTILPRECVGDRSEAVQRANIFDIDAKFADVLPLAEVLRYIDSLHPRFGQGFEQAVRVS